MIDGGLLVDTKEEKLKFWKLQGFRIWAIIGACVILLGILRIFDMIALGLMTIVVTVIIVFTCHGMVNRFERMGLPRLWGTLLTFLIGAVFLALIAVIIIPAIVSQATMLGTQVPYYFNRLTNFAREHVVGDGMLITTQQLYDISARVQDWATTNASTLIADAGTGAVGIGISLGNAGLVLFIAIIASLWLLIDLPKISVEFRRLFSESQQATLSLIASSFGDAFYGWGKATFVCALMQGVFCGIAFQLFGVPYSSILALICGVFYIVPYIGPVIFYVVCAVVGLTNSIWCGLLTIIINFVVHTVVTNLVSPKLMASSVNVHPAVTLIAIVIGEGIAGVLGMLLAVPVVAALQAIFGTYYESVTGKTLYTPEGALFQKITQKPMPKVIQKAEGALSEAAREHANKSKK